MLVQSEFEKRCMAMRAPTELSFVSSSFSMVFTLTSIPGNLLIILAVVLNPNKNLRTPFNWLLVNLATADLIVGTITSPISVYLHMKEGLKKKISIAEIQVIHMSSFISCTASVLSLSSLAVERYLAVSNKYRTKLTNKRLMLTVATVWLISLGLPNIYFVVGFTVYSFIFANTAVAVTFVITCVTYTLMLRKVKERSQNISNHNANVTEAPTSSSAEPSHDESLYSFQTANNSCSIVTSAREMEVKVTKMFVVVLIAMLCSYVPSTLLIYISNFCESCSCTTHHWLRDFQFIFILINSSVNFWCYAVRSPRFRSAFTKVLKIKKRNVPRVPNAPNVSFRRRKEGKENGEIKIEMSNNRLTNKGLDTRH